MKPTLRRPPPSIQTTWRIAVALVMTTAMGFCGGCGSSLAPTQFTPAAASRIDQPRVGAERPAATDRPESTRNIKMH